MSLLGPQLDAFLAITKHKTVHAAAEALYVTQTAITQRIRALETKLSTTLFIRTRRGMQLTPEGEALLRYCHAAQELAGEALAKIQGGGIQTTSRISITGPTSIMSSRIIPECVNVMQKYPNLLVHFDINDIENRDRALRAGDSDLAILQTEDITKEMESKLLHPEKYVLVCSAKWKGRKLKEILQNERIIDFSPADQMTFNYLKSYHLFEHASHERHYVNRTESIANMITMELGYGVLTKEFSQPYIHSGQLIVMNHGKIYENTIALAWYARHEPPHYFADLIKAIK